MSGEWTAERHREDAKLVRAAMQKLAERRVRGVVNVPIEDASDLLMALHRDGLYRPDDAEAGRTAVLLLLKGTSRYFGAREWSFRDWQNRAQEFVDGLSQEVVQRICERAGHVWAMPANASRYCAECGATP